jgi:hypothetical protein
VDNSSGSTLEQAVQKVQASEAVIYTEIRNQYVLTYIPVNAVADGQFRTIRLVAVGQGAVGQDKDKLIVRTRAGYYSGGKADIIRP